MELIKLFFKSIITGASMLIPGLSGGTTALLLGIYHPLLHAASNLLSDRNRLAPNLRYLTIAAIGALLGLILFSSPASYLYAAYKLPATIVFVACAAFGLPAILKAGGICNVTDLRLRDYSLICAGFFVVLLLFFLPSLISSKSGSFYSDSFLNTTTFFSSANNSFITASLTVAFFLLSGIVLAAALILPGISFSHMLLLLGLYTPTLNAIAQHNLPYLLALASSLVLGCLVTLRTCESLMTRHPRASTLFIFGFVLASCCQILLACF